MVTAGSGSQDITGRYKHPGSTKDIWETPVIDSRKKWRPSRRLCRDAFPILTMYPDGLTSNGDEDPDQVAPWIRAQLSTDQIRWLNNQGSVLKQGDLLKNALAEWVIRHPEDWFRGTHLADAIRLALTEFIGRHKDEFLTLD
jgi:hypothetical protein